MNQHFIPYGRQWIDEDDIAAVVEVLRSDMITQGPLVQEFEESLAAYCGTKYAVAVSSGTAGLHLACLAADIVPGDRVLTSPITFVASANCALYCGARPDFVDVDSRTFNLSPDNLNTYLNNYSGEDRLKAVIPVHFSGQPCDMEAISAIAQKNKLFVIEDACHALGAAFKGQEGDWYQVGSCSHSDMVVFSFHPVKHITTGEGGAVLTNDEGIYRRLKELMTHGITKDLELLEQIDGAWYYEMQNLGYNFRISDIQCALGLSQLKKIDRWVERRGQIAQIYDKEFKTVDEIILPYQIPQAHSSRHLYVIQIKGDLGRRKRVFDALRAEEIGVQVHYIPVHLHPYYKKRFGYSLGAFPKAEEYYARCLSLPIFPRMSELDVLRVVESIFRVMNIRLRG